MGRLGPRAVKWEGGGGGGFCNTESNCFSKAAVKKNCAKPAELSLHLCCAEPGHWRGNILSSLSEGAESDGVIPSCPSHQHRQQYRYKLVQMADRGIHVPGIDDGETECGLDDYQSKYTVYTQYMPVKIISFRYTFSLLKQNICNQLIVLLSFRCCLG